MGKPRTRHASAGSEPPAAKRRLLRGFFALTIVALVLHFVVIRTLGEPWPAVVMPGFDMVPEENGEVSFATPRVAFYAADSSRHGVDVLRLLAPLRWSHTPVIMNRVFRTPAPEEPAEDKEAFRARLQDPALHRWIRERLQAMGHERPARRLEITWREQRYRPGNRARAPVPLDTLVIDLSPTAQRSAAR